MAYLYLTADQIGITSGGGRVTQEESTALFDFATEQQEEFTCWDRKILEGPGDDPWKWDEQTLRLLENRAYSGQDSYDLCHVYAGTFSQTIARLKRWGCKISYTAAAHNVYLSEQEHRKLGIPFNYPHLTDPQLWQRYLAGYLAADMVICPSQHSAECMRSYGCQDIEIIPHGVDIVANELIKPIPYRFVVGYLGAVGPDKGLIYLLLAWKKLGYRNPDEGLLELAGAASQSDFVFNLIRHVFGAFPHTISLRGWVPNVADFYNDTSLYVQPSVTEGFGIEILEAMSHDRAVLCSTGAGAADVVPETWRFPAEDVDALAEKIDQFRQADLRLMGSVGRGLAKEYSWEIVRARYADLWRRLLG